MYFCVIEHIEISFLGIDYKIDPREVKARLDTPKVRTVLEMGYDSQLVAKVLGEQLRLKGKCHFRIEPTFSV